MRKIGIFLLILACMLGCTGCFCSHEWVDGGCLEPKTCPLCGASGDEAPGHSWEPATCQTPQVCKVCGETQGEAVDHKWMEATCDAPRTCRWCALTEGEATDHDWIHATTETPKTCSICGVVEGDRIITDERFTTAANRHLFGSWQTAVTMPGEKLGLAELVEEVRCIATVTFGEDGTARIRFRLEDPAAFRQELIRISQEDVYARFEAINIDREGADEQFADAYGMSIAAYCEETWSDTDWDAMLEIHSGSRAYYAEQDKLYTANNWGGEFSAGTYTLEENTLTAYGSDGTRWVLTRVG